MILPGFDAVIGACDRASIGCGMATVPGASQDTVTCRAGSLPQVSSSCSGAVVVGSGTVVVGGPDGGVAASALSCARASAPTLASPAAAPTTTTVLMNCRRDSPPSKSSVEEGPEPKMPESSMSQDGKQGW